MMIISMLFASVVVWCLSFFFCALAAAGDKFLPGSSHSFFSPYRRDMRRLQDQVEDCKRHGAKVDYDEELELKTLIEKDAAWELARKLEGARQDRMCALFATIATAAIMLMVVYQV